MRLTVKQMVLVVLALLSLLLAERANSRTLKPKDVKDVPIGRTVKAKGVVCSRRLDNGIWVLHVCQSRKSKECFDVRWHQYIVPDVGEHVEVEGERIR